MLTMVIMMITSTTMSMNAKNTMTCIPFLLLSDSQMLERLAKGDETKTEIIIGIEIETKLLLQLDLVMAEIPVLMKLLLQGKDVLTKLK